MNTNKILDLLYSIGLTEREAKIYYSLLQVKEASAPEIHRLSGIPRTKIYEAAEHLVSMGYLIEHTEGRSKHYKAAPLKSVKHTVVNQWEKEIEQKKQSANNIFEVLEDITSKNGHEEKKTDFVHVIRSKKGVSDQYISSLRAVKDEIVCFSRPPYASSDERSAKEQDEAELACLNRGVKYRVICMVDECWWNSNARSSSLDLSKQGIEIRYTNWLPIKMNVFDRQNTLIALASVPGITGTDFTMLEIQDPGFAESYMILFETFWQLAKTTEDVENMTNYEEIIVKI